MSEPIANLNAGGRCAPLACYAPWQPPFRYNMDGQWIEDSKGQRMLDMRGWGYLTGKGSEALGMEENAAAKIQDAIGQRVADLINLDQQCYICGSKPGMPTPAQAICSRCGGS